MQIVVVDSILECGRLNKPQGWNAVYHGLQNAALTPPSCRNHLVDTQSPIASEIAEKRTARVDPLLPNRFTHRLESVPVRAKRSLFDHTLTHKRKSY